MRSRVRSFCVAGLLLALSAVALPASSGAYVFWASNNVPNPIGRANLDGSGANQNFLPAATYFAPAVAVDGTHVYWTNGQAKGGDIERANLDGSEVISNFVPGAQAVRGLTVAGSFIYWSSGNCVGRANINGSEADNCFINDGEGLNQVAVGGNRIYWTNRNLSYLSSSDMQGENIKELYEGESGNGLTAGPDGIYFTNGKHGICFMSYDGKVIIEGVAPTHGGYGLAVSGNYLYWAAGAIGRVNLQGGELNEEFIKPASPAYDVAVEPSVAPPPPPPGPPAPANPTLSPIVKHTPLKCKKGFQRKSVRGKVRCVKKHRKHRHHK